MKSTKEKGGFFRKLLGYLVIRWVDVLGLPRAWVWGLGVWGLKVFGGSRLGFRLEVCRWL